MARTPRQDQGGEITPMSFPGVTPRSVQPKTICKVKSCIGSLLMQKPKVTSLIAYNTKQHLQRADWLYRYSS